MGIKELLKSLCFVTAPERIESKALSDFDLLADFIAKLSRAR